MKKKKANYPKIRIPAIPPSQTYESKVKPVSRAKIRRKGKKEIKEELTELPV